MDPTKSISVLIARGGPTCKFAPEWCMVSVSKFGLLLISSTDPVHLLGETLIARGNQSLALRFFMAFSLFGLRFVHGQCVEPSSGWTAVQSCACKICCLCFAAHHIFHNVSRLSPARLLLHITTTAQAPTGTTTRHHHSTFRQESSWLHHQSLT